MDVKQAVYLPMVTPQMTEFLTKVNEVVDELRDNAIPSEVAVGFAVEAVLKVLDGVNGDPGYLVIPRNPDPEHIDELQEAASISGHLHALFTEINS